MTLLNTLDDELSRFNLSAEEFSEIIIRLLNYGVITRDENQTESQLYDRFVRCQDLVEDYLSVMRVIVLHDAKFCYVRIFPPDATVPGVATPDDLPYNTGFRTKPSQQEVAVILVLRVEYEKALREGLVDEKGAVMIAVENVALAIKHVLKRELPENQSERRKIFKHLRQLRLIKYKGDIDLSCEDSWLSIQPSITRFVSDDVLEQLSTTLSGNTHPSEPTESEHTSEDTPE